MKKQLTALLIALALCFAVGCNNDNPPVENREYDESEVLAVAEALISKTVLLNQILWGEGVPTSQSESAFTVGQYVEADGTWLSDNGISSVTALKAEIEGVYSVSTVAWIDSTVFQGVQSTSGFVSLSRYIDYTTEDEIPVTYFLVNSGATVYAPDSVEYRMDTLRVLGSEGEIVKVAVGCTVFDKETSKTQERELTFNLLEEQNGFRIVGPTYVFYQEP